MFSSLQPSQPNSACPSCGGPELAELTARRLVELERLRDMGFKQAKELTAVSALLSPEQRLERMIGPGGTILGYERVVRAIRQITVLEFELRGLFKAPDRDAPRKLRLVKSDRADFEPPDLPDYNDLDDYRDLNDRDDYRIRLDYKTGPYDEVVAGIRKTLHAEPPPDDPFAPGAGRKPPEAPRAESANANRAPAVPQPPVERPSPALRKPPMPQAKPALKAAVLAVTALAGKGFRKPSSKPRGPSGTPPRRRRRNRGPPK